MRPRGHDAVVIGSGAGGGPLALALARAGLQVLVLEKGPRHRPEEYPADELSNRRQRFFLPDLDAEPHTLVTPATARPGRTELGWTATCVGGGTVHMGAFLYRFHPDDFRMRSRFGAVEELADWPFGYEELEPYYALAECELGVAGAACLGPFQPPRSGPYPLPPLDSHPVTPWLEAACRRRGLHPFPTPRGINSRPYQGRPACVYCNACAGYGCRVGAKGSAAEALLPRAEATGRCEVRPGCMVREVLVDRHGRAAGCVYLDEEGREHEAPARLVFVCCSAVESARLLLLSRSSRFPDGLANGSGLVGRHLQFHGVTMGEGRLRFADHPELPLRPWHPFLGVSLMDHYFLAEAVSAIGKGGLLRFDVVDGAPLARAELLLEGADPVPWGAGLKRRLRDHYREHRTLGVEVFHDFLPNARTFVDLDHEVRDRWGLPAARIHLDLPEHHRLAGRWVLERAFEILADLGAIDLRPSVVGGTSSYMVQGTCRMGADPRASVLDEHCQAHEVPNLYVVDGSCMPTSGGAPPTLTIAANSFRVAAHVAARWREGDLASR